MAPETKDITPDMQRLIRYGLRFDKKDWLVNQKDAIPALEMLEALEMIERNEDGTRWRLIR